VWGSTGFQHKHRGENYGRKLLHGRTGNPRTIQESVGATLSMVRFVSATELELEGYFCIHTVWLCVCTGKPNPDPEHPDYVPSINMDGKRKEGDQTHKIDRYERVKRRRLSVLEEVTNTITSDHEEEGEQTKDTEMYTKEEYTVEG